MLKKTNNRKIALLLTKAVFVWLPLVLVSPHTAFGYADPGSGAFVYQAAYAAFLGGAYYLRKLLDWVFRKPRQR